MTLAFTLIFILFGMVSILALAGNHLHSEIVSLQRGRNVPMPKMIDGPRCAHCNKPVGPDAAEVSMSVKLFDDKEIPVTFKICQNHAA